MCQKQKAVEMEGILKERTKNEMGKEPTGKCSYKEEKAAVVREVTTEHTELHRTKKSLLHRALTARAKPFKGHGIPF